MQWARGIGYAGPHSRQVIRSLLTLRGLAHAPTGGIVAAPTAGLPEREGGGRNWDYRYCWLRDAAFTVLTLMHAGLNTEARAWMTWLRRAVAGEPTHLQPFYSVNGERRIPEWEADWLAGFNGAQPVRFGNGAGGQLQLDTYGEVLDAIFFAERHGVIAKHDYDPLVRQLAAKLETIWREPDAGLWESRGKPRHHTYSKVMCWAAFDRAACWLEGGDPAASRRYRRLAGRAKAEVLAKGFDRRLGSFTRAFDDRALDAAALRIPLIGFLPADDPRMVGTVAAIERRLLRDGLVWRYETGKTDDGLKGREGAFIAAGFWLVDVYALQGRQAEAEALFARLCGVANDLDLLSEEVDPRKGLLGNFPQALSHLALVGAALTLSGAVGPARERSAGG